MGAIAGFNNIKHSKFNLFRRFWRKFKSLCKVYLHRGFSVLENIKLYAGSNATVLL